jgi:hypothetical protein
VCRHLHRRPDYVLRLMHRVGVTLLIAAAIGGVVWGFRPGGLHHLGWFVLGGAALYGALSAILPEKILRQRLRHRPSLSFNEIYSTSFQQLPYSRALVEEVWNELARDLGVDADRIMPTDRFGDELSVRAFPLVDLNEAAYARLRERLRRAKADPHEAAEVPSVKTLWDYVNLACRLEAQYRRA